MKIISKVLAAFFLVLFISQHSLAQSSEIKIKFIGNCGLHLSDGLTNIYTDFPYKSGAYNYMEYDDAQLDSIPEDAIFIFTHKHADHYSRKALKHSLKHKNGRKYGKWNIKALKKLSETIPDFNIEVYQTKHRFSFSHYSYLITWHGKKIFLSGDTESAETIGNVNGIDWAFIPYWILNDAKDNNITIDAKMKVLYHLYPNQKFTGQIPEDLIFLREENQMIRIPY